MNCKSIDIYTDVEGIRQADPKRFPDAENIEYISYYTALSAGIKGLKLIYPDMIDFALSSGVDITFYSIFNTRGCRTIVSDSKSSKLPLIIRIDNLNILYIHKSNTAEISKINMSYRNQLLFNWEENNHFYFVMNLNGNKRIIEDKKIKSIDNWCRLSVINNDSKDVSKIITLIPDFFSGKDYRLFLNGSNNEISIFTDIKSGRILEIEIFNTLKI